jgi:hypothetical protein
LEVWKPQNVIDVFGENCAFVAVCWENKGENEKRFPKSKHRKPLAVTGYRMGRSPGEKNKNPMSQDIAFG